MNIFKVLASAKKGFAEEQASALIVWLLNPYMEHGLGFAFLDKFLKKIFSSEEYKELEIFLQPILRNEKSSNNLEFSPYLEFHVKEPQSYIDIVIFINDILISIENKIRCESAGDKGQLARQYEGLKKEYGEKRIVIIFLVPNSDNESIKKEFEELKIRDKKDISKMITWDDIRKIIQEILNEEQNCEISPINEYLRHTLKALSNFIDGDFEGYYYKTEKNYGKNPLAEYGRKTFSEIKQDENIKYVGVNDGIIGLLSLKSTDLEKNTFQFTNGTERPNWKWLKRELFIKLCGYVKAEKYDDLDWIGELERNSLPASVIYNIAKHTDVSFYIGIQGGNKALSGMESDVIEKKRWSISLKQKTGQWMKKDEFIQIIEDKSVYFL